MNLKPRIVLAAAALALGGGLAVLPASAASAAYTCHYSVSGGDHFAGYYSGYSVTPSSTGVSSSGIEAQCLLKRLGYNPGTIDGVLGPNSKKAAHDFQQSIYDSGQHIKVDGIVGEQTWAYLRAF
ncbi:peptidoglycan-binding domain-containing protein [Cryptosporangium phraense]|uniref:peptidoglycan-binding domain-containing protein n=1 Tax=Cryptosporangium phraense TaxID=2593070 RepID=UPI001478F525|nr:peptidoglycan-binding domain-containing protein [Cryptosporangium phraense]